MSQGTKTQQPETAGAWMPLSSTSKRLIIHHITSTTPVVGGYRSCDGIDETVLPLCGRFV